MASPHFGTEEIEFFSGIMQDDGLESNGRWSDWNTSDFCLLGCMKSRMYRGSKPEESHQLVETITEGAVRIGK
jgi:hypothetical protein